MRWTTGVRQECVLSPLPYYNVFMDDLTRNAKNRVDATIEKLHLADDMVILKCCSCNAKRNMLDEVYIIYSYRNISWKCTLFSHFSREKLHSIY